MNRSVKEKSTIKIIGNIVRLSFHETPKFILLMLSIGLVSALFQGIITVQTHRMLSAAGKTFGSDQWMIKTAVQGAVLCGVIIMAQLLNGLHNYSYDLFINKMKNKLGKKLNSKLGSIRAIMFEDTEFLNWIDKSKVGMESSIEVLLILLDIGTYYLPYFIFMGIYLYRVNPSFIVILVLIFVPVFSAQLIRMSIFGKLEDKSSILRRRMNHYESCVSDIQYLKETRILGAVDYFKKRFISTLENFNKNITKSSLKANNYELILDCVTLAGYVMVIFMLINSMITGRISVAAFGAIYTSISTMFSMMEEILRYNIGNISEQMGSVKNFIGILNHESSELGEEETFHGEIELKNVSFRYPEGKKDVIKDISLVIKEGETIAIVGENGSGKSTLGNILLGIYEATDGEIFISGKKRERNKYNFNNKSALFQRFQKYKLSLKDNIHISDLKKSDGLKNVLDKANIGELYSKEKDTMMSVEFDGIDLSGGQWQRVSLARALYKDSRFILLDEPTSSIDAIEEDTMYNRFKEISKDKTAIIITHHLGSISFVDRIIVMNDGKIVENGTHGELIDFNGIYKKMYETQQSNYI